MKRFAFAVAMATAFVLGTGAAAANHSQNGNSDGGPKDFAVGGGQYVNPAFGDIELSAHDGPRGPSGHVVRTPEFKGHVTCINVAGNLATVGYEVEKGPFAGFGGLVRIEDNGRPSGVPDEVQHQTLPSGPPAECPTPGPVSPVFAIDGNFTVHDAP